MQCFVFHVEHHQAGGEASSSWRGGSVTVQLQNRSRSLLASIKILHPLPVHPSFNPNIHKQFLHIIYEIPNTPFPIPKMQLPNLVSRFRFGHKHYELLYSTCSTVPSNSTNIDFTVAKNSLDFEKMGRNRFFSSFAGSTLPLCMYFICLQDND